MSQAATPLPYTEVFGDLQTERCGAEWVGGVCEEGWRARGARNSIQMVRLVADETRHVMLLTPGDGMWNGVTRTFDVRAQAWVRVGAWLFPVEGSSTFYMRVIFRDRHGVTLDTRTRKELLDGPKQVAQDYPVPAGAVTAELIWAAVDGEDPRTRVAILAPQPELQPCKNDCHFHPFIPGGNFPVDVPEAPEPPDECPSTMECDTEECNISCEEGEVPLAQCVEASCGLVGGCTCVDAASGESPLESDSAYIY